MPRSARRPSTEDLIAECARQEEELQFTQFRNSDALALGLAILQRAQNEGKAVAVDIERHGQQLFHHGMEGTAPDNDEWIRRKNRLVNRVGMSSYRFTLKLEASGETMADRALDPLLYANSGGAFPIRIRNAGVIGTVTASGLPHEQDHALVVAGIRDFLAAQNPAKR